MAGIGGLLCAYILLVGLALAARWCCVRVAICDSTLRFCVHGGGCWRTTYDLRMNDVSSPRRAADRRRRAACYLNQAEGRLAYRSLSITGGGTSRRLTCLFCVCPATLPHTPPHYLTCCPFATCPRTTPHPLRAACHAFRTPSCLACFHYLTYTARTTQPDPATFIARLPFLLLCYHLPAPFRLCLTPCFWRVAARRTAFAHGVPLVEHTAWVLVCGS